MTAIILTFHLLLFGVKAWAIFMFIQKYKSYPYMLIWSIIYMTFESWFIHRFFIDIDLYHYEIIAIIDQCIFTIGLVFYLTKEAQNGKRTD